MKPVNDVKIAIVVSRFNRDVTSRLLEGALYQFQQKGVAEHNIKVVDVPGAVEIPLICQQLAKQKRYDAIVSLGAVIRGETSHYDYVCEQVSQGCQQVSLAFELPVVFAVLTTENKHQAMDRLGGQHGHKGYEAADCALEMIYHMHTLQT